MDPGRGRPNTRSAACASGPRLTYANVVATLALTVALGGGAYAATKAIPEPGGVISSCYRKHDGNLRVIAQGKKCKKSQAPLAFNQQGPNGDQGLQGLQGVRGDPRAPGQKGGKGDTGAPGPTFGQSTFPSFTHGMKCDQLTVAEQTLTVHQPSRIFATGQGAYDGQSTNLKTGEITIQLFDSAGTTLLATLGTRIGTDFDGTNGARIPITNAAVLSVPGQSTQPTNSTFVAQAGTYKLRLLAVANDGTCTGTWSIWLPSLGYVLLGNQD